MKELPKSYQPQKSEDKIYKQWEESGYFNPDNLDGEPFSIMMPPPNVTGVLHLGHAMENTLMDAMIRYQRMNGKKTLLLPGTDHAAVATQAKVEKILIAKGTKNPREELGREKLLEEIRIYAEQSKSTIISQIRKMGTSCDWSRLAYTFDDIRSQAVNTVFKKMYNDGLIYRGYRVINWSVKGQSTCSDDELEYTERSSKLYTFKYSKDFPITIATTRPETKLGDTAVAVNPNDKRYAKYIGKVFTVDVGARNPLQIKIISDDGVEKDFGTGALGVTPAHSPIDFAMYEKQKANGTPIEIIQVIDTDGKMTAETGTNYEGLTVEEAREKFVSYLKENNLLEKEENIIQSVGVSDRFGDVIEAIPMTQWFIDVNKKIPGKDRSLKELMQDALDDGLNNDVAQKINITPKRFKDTYFSWIDNLRDWCISRQLWWGHQIPVWYRQVENQKLKVKSRSSKDNQEIYVGIKPPKNKYTKAILLHDWGSNPNKAFFPWLKTELENQGLEVIAPSLPNAKNPDFNAWLAEFKKLNIDENTLVIGRSLGSTLALAAAQQGHKIGKLIAVCTPLTNDVISKFFDDIGEWQFDKIRQNINEIVVVHSTDDPFIPEKVSQKISSELSTPLIMVENADHFTSDQYSEILEACNLWTQDPDTLDTWFSSGLWTFSTLGWPKQTDDYKNFHPTDWMQMGRDILFFWMARMILMTTYSLDTIPFKDVYIHGMLKDKDGKKFSKSAGNTMDPLDVIKKYGTDALRLSLVTGISPGNDLKIYNEKIESSRNFVTKLWNIGRYINTSIATKHTILNTTNLSSADEWILRKLNTLIINVGISIDKFNFSQASEMLREFTWSEFADWYVEIHKVEKNDDVLVHVYRTLLKLWHPFIPFVTETIWQEMFDEKQLLMVTKYPQVQKLITKSDKTSFEVVKELIVTIRNIRATFKVPVTAKINITLITTDTSLFKSQESLIQKLAGVQKIVFNQKDSLQKESASAVFEKIKLYVHLSEIIDIEKEKRRLKNEIKTIKKYLNEINIKLSNKKFIANAPSSIIKKEKEKLSTQKLNLKNLKKHFENLD